MSLLILKTYEVVKSGDRQLIVSMNAEYIAEKQDLDEQTLTYRLTEGALIAVAQNLDVIQFENFPVRLVAGSHQQIEEILIAGLNEQGQVVMGVKLIS